PAACGNASRPAVRQSWRSSLSGCSCPWPDPAPGHAGPSSAGDRRLLLAAQPVGERAHHPGSAPPDLGQEAGGPVILGREHRPAPAGEPPAGPPAGPAGGGGPGAPRPCGPTAAAG